MLQFFISSFIGERNFGHLIVFHSEFLFVRVLLFGEGHVESFCFKIISNAVRTTLHHCIIDIFLFYFLFAGHTFQHFFPFLEIVLLQTTNSFLAAMPESWILKFDKLFNIFWVSQIVWWIFSVILAREATHHDILFQIMMIAHKLLNPIPIFKPIQGNTFGKHSC